MLLSISGQNVKIPSDLKAYVADKAANLGKYYRHLDRVLVTLRRGANGAAIARIVASGKRRRCFIAQETADTAYGSINRATRDLERQLSEANDRRTKKHNRKPVTAYGLTIS